jgi:AcrR family transcriptional regulator
VARPRTITNGRVLAGVAAAVAEVGPVRLTLADVARHAGVSTGVLVQRYGSKRNLLLAFCGQQGAFVETMRKAYEQASDPVDGLIDAVALSAGTDISPEEFANHLAFLHLELADPEFRTVLAEHAAAVRVELAHYLAEAVAAGRLVVDDVAALVAAVDSIRNGTQLTWAMTLEGSLGDALRRDLNTLFRPLRRVP